MAADIAPELISNVNKEFQNNCLKDLGMRKLTEKVLTGTATYEDAYKYAESVGNARAAAFASEISSEVLPDGKMYYNIASRLLGESLTEDHELVSDFAQQVQQAINENAGIRLKAQTADLDESRIKNFIEGVCNADNYDDVKWKMGSPVVTHARSVVDDTVKKNAKFQSKVGIKVKIVRHADSKCCPWCDDLVGEYTYPGVPSDVFMRHDNCRCSLDYDGRKLTAYDSDGKAHSFRDQEEKEKISARKNKADELSMDYKPVVRDSNKAVAIKAKEGTISAKQLAGSRNNLYLSDEIDIKPRELHRIEQQIDFAKNVTSVSGNVKYVVVSDSELGKTTGGRFDPETGSIYIKVMQDKAEQLYTIVHESFHLKDYEDYINKGNIYVSKESFISDICENSKRKLDKIGIDIYNVREISDYAADSYRKKRFDEVFTEYRTVRAMEGR